ncbi:MAG: hypothetical protein WC504_06740 [Methylobacter sp.]|jgi:hypothetical protein
MTIYSGMVKSVSSGVETTGPQGGARSVVRDFVEIEKNRIRNVVLASYIDQFLVVGEAATLSGFHRGSQFIVAALKRSNGEIIRLETREFIFPFIAIVFLAFIAMIVVGGIVGGMTNQFLLGLIVFLGGFYWIGLRPMFAYFAARRELS